MTVFAKTYSLFSLLLQSTFGRSIFRVLAIALMACVFCMLGLSAAQAQSVIHVTESGDGAASGSSWGDATTLQNALGTATGSDVVVIAGGTYAPGSTQDDRFEIDGSQDGLKIYGGWSGTETFADAADVENQLDSRDLRGDLTVLSGDIDNNDNVNGDGVTEVPGDISGDNSYTIVYLNGTTGDPITTDTVLDGLAITGGQANGSDTSDLPRVGGAGVYCDGAGSGNECSPHITNTTFIGNLGTAGSAFLSNGTNGGMSIPEIAHTTFTHNSAVIGGAMYNPGVDGQSSPTLTHVTFADNAADNNGGAIFNDGRNNGVSNPQVRHATFTENSAGSNGGAIYNEGRDNGTSSPEIANTAFADNSAGSNGGAMYNTGAFGNDFQSGTSSPQITNTVFANNSANSGGAMYNVGNDGEVSPQIINTTLTGNSASNNGGALSNRGTFGTDTSPQITNSILWDNRAGSGSEIYNNGSFPTLGYTLIEGGLNGSGVDGNDNNDDGNNFGSAPSDVPQFTDANNPAGNDGVFGTADDGLRLQPGSAALDAGNNDAVPAGITTDLLDQDRIQDSDEDGTATVSLGAYEGFITSPVTRGIAPTAARPGSTISVRGINFTGAENVTIGGTSVSYMVQSDTEVTATVPATASPASAPVVVNTPNGAASPRAFRITSRPYGSGQALTMDGDGDYVSADAASDVMADADAFTMEAWMRLDSNTDRPAVLAFNGAVEDNKNILFYDSGQFQYYDPDITFQSSRDTFAPERWHHVAVVLESGGEGTLYVNGTEQATFTTSVRPVSGGRFSIGQEWDDDTPSDFFAGQIDEVRLWDTARTADEIRQSMHQTIGTPASAPGLVGYWRFDTDAETEATSDAYDWAGPSIGTLEGDAERTAAPGAPLGQTAALVSGEASQTVGPDGGTAEVTNQSAPDTDTLAVYQYGTTGGDLIEAGAPGEDFDATGVTQRLNVTWGIEPVADGDSSASAEVTFDFSGLAGINDPGAVLLLKREGPGQPWQDVTGPWTLDAEAETFSRSGVGSFSEYAIAGDEQALPVELAGFDARRSGDESVTVQWETLSETNNAGFEVQRAARPTNGSADASNVETPQWDVSTGESWETVARLDGAGTTDAPQSYRFEDTDLPYEADSLRYRLRQIDTDGTESFSEAVTIGRPVTEAELLPTYPNPARSQAMVRFAVPDQQPVRIHLYDMLGRRVQTVVDTDAEGRTEAQLDVSTLASGTYFLRMETEGGPVATQRVTVVR